VPAAGGVLILDLRQTHGIEAAGQPNDRWPKAAVDERDLAVDETSHDDIGSVTEGARCPKDFLTFRVAPPRATDLLSGHELSDARNRPVGRFQENSVFLEQPVDIHNEMLWRRLARRRWR
jgi:hypothetical protein